jgi:OmpA-OmpF porin, OOP family
MKLQLSMVACTLILVGCTSQAQRDRLGIEDPTVLKTAFGTAQDVASGAVTPQWLSTYAPVTHGGDALAALQQQVNKLPSDKNSYFRAKAQCWIDAGEAQWRERDQWGFVEEAIGQAAMITFALENDTVLSAANSELRTVSMVRPDLWKIVNIIKSDPATARCPESQAPLACAEVDLMLAGHYGWTRNFSAAEKVLPGIQENLRKSAEAALQCAQPNPATVAPTGRTSEPAITLRADSAFSFNGSDIAALLPGARAELNALVANLPKVKGIRGLNVSGYTDRLGSDRYNQKLSLQRAVTVKAYLIERGVSLPITATGQGKTRPIVECGQADRKTLVQCLVPNRRVEIDFARGIN